MKYIFIIFLSLILTNCKKQVIMAAPSKATTDLTFNQTHTGGTTTNAAGSQASFYYTGAASTTGVTGDKGLRADIDVKKLTGGNFTMKSIWIAFTFTDGSGNSCWTQWGYGLNSAYGYVNIITTWMFTGGTHEIYPATTYLASAPLTFNTQPTFAITNVGGTLWRYSRDGVDLYEVDLNTSAIGTRIEVQIESQGNYKVKWPLLNVKNIQTYDGGTAWQNVSTAGFQGNSFSNTGLSLFGLQGQVQNPALAKAELNFGGSLPGCPSNANLWVP